MSLPLQVISNLCTVYADLNEIFQSPHVAPVFDCSNALISTKDDGNKILVSRQRLERGHLSSRRVSPSWRVTLEKIKNWFIGIWQEILPNLELPSILQPKTKTFLQPPFHNTSKRLLSRTASGVAAFTPRNLDHTLKELKCIGKVVGQDIGLVRSQKQLVLHWLILVVFSSRNHPMRPPTPTLPQLE